MGTKNKPGDFDCYTNAEPDEPMFILLGRDPLAPSLVFDWANRREQTRGPSAKVEEARACAQAMLAWQERAPTAEDTKPSLASEFDQKEHFFVVEWRVATIDGDEHVFPSENWANHFIRKNPHKYPAPPKRVIRHSYEGLYGRTR